MALNYLINGLQGPILEPFVSEISSLYCSWEVTKLVDIRGKDSLVKMGQDCSDRLLGFSLKDVGQRKKKKDVGYTAG